MRLIAAQAGEERGRVLAGDQRVGGGMDPVVRAGQQEAQRRAAREQRQRRDLGVGQRDLAGIAAHQRLRARRVAMAAVVGECP